MLDFVAFFLFVRVWDTNKMPVTVSRFASFFLKVRSMIPLVFAACSQKRRIEGSQILVDSDR